MGVLMKLGEVSEVPAGRLEIEPGGSFASSSLDDMIIIGDDYDGIELLKAELSHRFAMKDLGLLHYFLGIKVASPLKGYLLSQSKYISDLFDRARMIDNKIVDIPIDAKAKYTPTDGDPLPDLGLNHTIVRNLVYLIVTQPDIAYVIHIKSKKQDVISKSSTEVEYRVMAVTTSKIIWLRWLLADVDVHITSPTPLYCDNRSAIQIARNTVFHERTKHIEIDCHVTRHHLQFEREYELRKELEILVRNGQVLCLITDALWHFTQSVADILNLPRLVLRTSDGGPSIEERADLFSRSPRSCEEKGFSKTTITFDLYQDPKFLIKMPPRKNRTLNEIHEQELEDRVMARIEERFDQFIDQLSDRMDQLMNRHVNIPDFAGDTLSPEGFIDWLVTVEEVFEFKEVPENKRVSLIATKLHVQIMDYVNMFDPMTLSDAYQRALGNMASCFSPSQAKAGGGNTGPVSRASEGDDDAAYEEYEEAPVYDEEPECEEEYVSGDVGSTCTILGKLCTFVCDSGSCDNLIAAKAVQKLGLKTKNHPKPYKLQWLKKGGEVTVSKHVHVPFSMGNTYKDNVWCDMVPMDACHLGVKITLMPNKPKEVVSKPTGTLLTLSQFEDELEMGDDVFVLIGKEVAEDSEIPKAMIPLLEEFLDVFPDELPDGLPLLRDIQHHTDLEPKTQLPNRPHYRISPGEHKDLRRQVKELVSKGHVHESISSCAVPALLTPKKDGTWRMCVDSQAINKITMSGYYQIRLRPSDEWKTAFKTREGLYEWPFIGKFVVVYFDDILIYSASFNKHVSYVRQVLTLLRKDSDGIHVDESKVAAVQQWPTPTTITKVWSFHGLASFYKRFIPNFSSIMTHLTDCIKVFELHTDASKVAIGGVLSQVVQVVKHWHHKEFVLFNDHDSLRHIRTQDKAGEKLDFFLHDEFLFKRNQLCIPDSSLRLQIIKELHGEGHVGRHRTLQLVQASYFWPTMRKEVDRYVNRCRVCQVLKGTTTNAGLYMPLHVPLQP
ncbi:putative nucleotidyltransferase, ribonuclease H [Tanacetum coccineum]